MLLSTPRVVYPQIAKIVPDEYLEVPKELLILRLGSANFPHEKPEFPSTNGFGTDLSAIQTQNKVPQSAKQSRIR